MSTVTPPSPRASRAGGGLVNGEDVVSLDLPSLDVGTVEFWFNPTWTSGGLTPPGTTRPLLLFRKPQQEETVALVFRQDGPLPRAFSHKGYPPSFRKRMGVNNSARWACGTWNHLAFVWDEDKTCLNAVIDRLRIGPKREHLLVLTDDPHLPHFRLSFVGSAEPQFDAVPDSVSLGLLSPDAAVTETIEIVARKADDNLGIIAAVCDLRELRIRNERLLDGYDPVAQIGVVYRHATTQKPPQLCVGTAQ